MRKVIGVALVLCMLIGSMTGCSKDKEVKDTPQTQGTGSETQAPEQNFDKKETISINIIDTDLQDKDRRYKYLEDKFNVEFNLISCSLNDVEDKNRIWVAGGDMPDVMWTEIENASELRSWAEGGAIRELPDLSKYPNLKKLKDLQKSDDTLQADNKDYFITTKRDQDRINNLETQAIVYRKDWAQKLGLYKESYTWDDMLEMAKAMVTQDPGENGKGKTLGMVGVGWAYPAFSGIQQISPYWSTFTEKDGKYVWGPELPETLEGIKMAKRMYDENIVWQEQSLAQTQDGPTKFYSGQAGILYHNLTYNNVLNLLNGLKETYPGKNVLDMVEVMNVTSPDGTKFAAEAIDSWGALCFREDIDEEKMDRMLSILDFMASDEGIMLQQYGVEGVDYTKENDQIKMLWDKDENGNYVSPYEVNSDRLLSLARLFEYEKSQAAYADPDTKVIEDQLEKFLTTGNITVQKIDYGFNSFSGPNKDQSNLETEVSDKITDLIIGSNDIEKEYKDWLDQQKDKKDDVLKELNDNLLNK